MMHCKVTYTITAEFDAVDDAEAYKIQEKQLNAIFCNGVFEITGLRMEGEYTYPEEEERNEGDTER